MSQKVAPGMEIAFSIQFSPEAKSDYSYDLMVLTEREKFVVPIRAVGCRSMLDFPDLLDFGQVPVKHVTEKPVMIRNIGEKPTKWQISVPSGFELSKKEGILEVAQTEQLVFRFIPQESRAYKDELVLSYDHMEAVIPIKGEAHNDNVYLSKSHIHMEPTSITLYSHQYYTIVNKSQVPIEFSWRAFSTDKEEREKKNRLIQQLFQEEEEEKAILETQDIDLSGDESLDSDDSYDETELKRRGERVREKAITTLSRKYQGIRKAVEEDPMVFQDEIFSIEPLEGKIWPNTEITCCVTFRPQGPYHYSCTAYCNTTCSEERLSLHMTGQGKGPQAQLSMPESDIGDIFVNYEKQFDVGIENTGEIDCHWKLIPYETPFGSKFHFSKTEGILGVNQSVRDLIKVTFKSDILGEFSETFRFALEGSSDMLTLTFKGHVVAPTFKFSEEIIDFGRVSYKFPIYKTVYLTNTSEVDINYVVRVPGDGRSVQQEFNISNNRGRLERLKEAKIEIEFIPCFPSHYDMVLVVDLEGVGQDMLAVPIKAECLVPKVKVNPLDYLEYDTCFLRHPKSRQIEIINEDSLCAKYEIVPQDDQSKRIAVYTADRPSGVIEPHSSQVVNISLRTEILSTVRIPLYVKVEGHHIPFMVTVLATSTGPLVEADREELDYGSVEVLKDVTQKLKIKNKSKIPAEYTAFTKLKESIWKVIQRHGVLQPDDEREIEVVCNADEVQKFQDTLHIIINNGVDLEVGLKAKGTGSTLFCRNNLETIDFGVEYTHQNITKEFFLENRGRKPMKIQWVRTTKLDKKKKQTDPKQGDTSKNQGNESVGTEAKEEEEVKFVFAVVPETMQLNPKMGYKVQFRANSGNIGKVLENWQCQATIGGERKPKIAFNSNVQGEFITPSLSFNEPKLFFKYLWEKGVASMPITKNLAITNAGPLPTTLALRIDPPFSCLAEKLSLGKGESETISIDFDPGMKQDRLSDSISGKLSISHANHPHKDQVQLQGEVAFPNLQILPPNIDFGCILNDTSKKKYLVLTNISEMPVNYEWSFLEEDSSNLNAVLEEDETRRKKKKPKALPINEVFDILPVSGRLEPGKTENVEFTFRAGHGLLYNGVAVCSVDGGPDYEVPIVGESSFVDFKLSTQELDFGEVPYNESSCKEFFIENIGKVPFEFNINLASVSRPGIIQCNFMTGKVIAGERYKVLLKFFPGVPDNIDEYLLVECGHFPPVRFRVRAVGIYPGCLMSFPRSNEEEFQRRVEKAKQKIELGNLSYAAPFNGDEALRLMPTIQAKMVDREKAMIKDPRGMEAEAEADRELLCQRIIQKLHQSHAPQPLPQFQTSNFSAPQQNSPSATLPPVKKNAPKVNKKTSPVPGASVADKASELGGSTMGSTSVESISLASYVCDLGNVVVGSTKKKSFRLTNVGKLPVTFQLDKKLLTQAGLTIEPEKVQKLSPNCSQLFNVVYTTRSNAKLTKQKFIVPVDVKGGPSYQLEFIANLTIPELSMSSDNLDFGKVCVQTRKTVKIRFENKKEVACDWSYYYKPDISTAATAAKEGERFQVFPLSGVLQPGQRQTVDVMFTPSSDKLFQEKLSFRCKDNKSQFSLNVKGQGIHYQVDIVPETLALGPVLPYDTLAIKEIELRNPMDQPIEVVSTDFDKQYIEEEEILKRLEFFQSGTSESLFLPLRTPGAGFWPQLKEQDERKRKMDGIKDRLSQIEGELAQLLKEEQGVETEEGKESKQPPRSQEEISERRNQLTEQKAKVESELAKAQEERLEVKYPQAVKEHEKLNVVLIGPKGSGKSLVANYLQQEHQRAVVKLDQLYDWCIKRGSPVAEEATKYLENLQEEYNALLAEQEKKKKAKKKGKEEEPELNPDDFKKLSQPILVKMLKERLAQEDCNAGAIFDNLESQYWNGTKTAIEMIVQAVPVQNLMVLLMRFQKDLDPETKEGEGVEVVTNYRYMLRRLNVESTQEEEKQPEQEAKEDKKKTKKQPPKGVQKGAKQTAMEEDEKQDLGETDKKAKDNEEKQKIQEQPKIVQKLPDYSHDEQTHYQAFADDLEHFFAELSLRQSETQSENSTGSLTLVPQFIEQDFNCLCLAVRQKVPSPVWPDADKEPLPPPTIHQIIRKPPQRPERKEITLFQLWTPNETREGEEQGETQQTRWVLGPRESKKVVVKFFSTKTGTFTQTVKFEVVGSLRSFDLGLTAVCDFPTVNKFYRNVFMSHKKTRPPTMPESLLQKTFVVSENLFDFGPLLIKKDPEQRNKDEKLRSVNSSVMQITNNGKYKVEASFTLKSTLPFEEGGFAEKSPFIVEPDFMELEVDETKHLTVFSFPETAKLFKDEIICLIKNNPTPTTFSIQAQGAEPIIEVDTDVVSFDRLLLGKKLAKTLTLKNVSPIPANWRLTGVEQLPKEFEVSLTSGTLRPCQEQVINLSFEAKHEDKFEPIVHLEVEDTEGYGVKQDSKAIKLQAEAFKISPQVQIGKDDSQVLDFGAVRVGEPKENTISIRNEGKYPIRYNFSRKKKLTREIFTVEPEQDELRPGEEKQVIVRFLSSREIKLKTSTQTSDLVLNILEGETLNVHQPIPINVNVNAVFSKYQITPLKTINFGPMEHGDSITRSFEIRNEGLFEFKFAICDDKDQESKQRIKEERHKEQEERIHGAQEQVEDPKAAKGKKPDPKAAKGGKAAGKEAAPPEGGLISVSRFEITPSQGSIPPGSAAVVNVTFKAEGAKFYESTLAVDIGDRDPNDQPEGVPFELIAESSVPGINTVDLDQIFEEQTVIPSLDPSLNTQTVITSSLYSTQERVFWFGTLIASKNPQGVKERFKIMNPNKIPCTVRFSVKPRSQSKSEGFAFAVSPDQLTIEPHKHKYVTVSFEPTAMLTYGGIFEATVDHGDPESKSGKLVFEVRGEGTLPSLLVDMPKELDPDGAPALRFKRTRIGKEAVLSIVLKNEGQVPATARFDALQSEAFQFLNNMSFTITPKSYQAFDIKFKPQAAKVETAQLTFVTMGNPFEQHRVNISGEGYQESVAFEGLPDDELRIGDCVVGKPKAVSFQLVNNGDRAVRFNWNLGEKEEFSMFPQAGHLNGKSSKTIKVVFKSAQSVKYDQLELLCETVTIDQKHVDEDGNKLVGAWKEWDDTMKTVRMVRPSELRKIKHDKEMELRRRREEAEAAAAAAKKGAKGGKAPPKKEEAAVEEQQIVIDESEAPTAELIDTIAEPEWEKVEGSERSQGLKTSLVCDVGQYECNTSSINFKPTLMYGQRTHKFSIKNTSMIALPFNFKIINPRTDLLDAGSFSIFPKRGQIAPGCDENFLLKFAPLEVEPDFSRLVIADFLHLDPAKKDLQIRVDGVAERPVIHFELPPSSYLETKKKDMTPVDSKFKIIEFESLGTNIKITRRFMAVNPTGQGYEFVWEEQVDESRSKPLFKCLTQKGVILSGKKSEMVFEYTPDQVGEHESQWIFRIPSENIVQHFLIVGRVNEPNVLFETGKIKFGPLLLGGKNRETVNLINQEDIPFSFTFAKESVRGSPDFGDSLRVNPVAGVVPPQSQLPIEIQFQPKFELNYNYNLVCNVKRKARPLVLNVKGEGYKIHHQVFAGQGRQEVKPSEPLSFEFGEFFINEKQTRKVWLQNSGEFNFDFVWKRQVNKYISITPETGCVVKGGQQEFEITYLPIGEHELKNYKLQLQIISGPKYEFVLSGKARRPGVKLSTNVIDFGPCFVSRQALPVQKTLVVTNIDSSAISIETDFEKKPHLDVLITPGQVLMPNSPENLDKLEIPIVFTPREIKSYQEKITFDFNNLYKVDVIIKGEGIPLLLDLKDPDQGYIDFGIVSVGGDVTKTVPLINRSKKPVSFKLIPSDSSLFQKCFVSFSPDQEVTLKPKAIQNVEIRFNPKQRLPNFNLGMLLVVEPNEPRQLISLQGVSHGIELKLMDEVVAFGSVVNGSRMTKYLQLSNFGDVKAHFSWDSKIYKQNFTITPESGYVNPNSNLDLEVTFHPTKADPDIRYNKVPCMIKGGDKLELNLMGKSVDLDNSTTAQLVFTTQVRKPITQSVNIQNTEDKEWAINPTISTEDEQAKNYFSGKSTLIVPPKSQAEFQVTYHPFTMTKPKKVKKKQGDEEVEVEEPTTHNGSLFFPLPNGTALLYRLQGTASAPATEGVIQSKVKAKKSKSIIIPVKNWSRLGQRFLVSWTVQGNQDPGLFIRGANALDIGPNLTKEYKVNFLSLKNGQYKFTVKFLSQQTGEYALFDVTVDVEEPELIGTIELASQIRESTSQLISIENPTDVEVTINNTDFHCDNEYIQITPPKLVIPPRTERAFEVHYRPLVSSGVQNVNLILHHAVLGDYKHQLVLKGLPPTTQRSMAFKTALGSDVMQVFKFTHYLKKPTNYVVKVERIDVPGAQCDFKAEVAQVPAPAAESHKGVDLQLNIKYEPFSIGDSRGVLYLTSAEGIEYTCLLFGKSTAPQPQGPIKCPAGAKPAGIDFKNPLNEKAEFVVGFDGPCFSLASKPPGPIDPGKVTNFQIKFEPKGDLPKTGRMMVTTKGLPPWVFYLQGE